MIDYIKRAKQLGLSPQQIDYIFFNNIELTKELMLRHGLRSKETPGNMPDSYFIDRINKNMPIKEIAKELSCTPQAIYYTLRRRGITADAHRTKLKEECHEP